MNKQREQHVTNALVGFAASPVGLGRDRLVDIWQAADLEQAQFRGLEAFATDLIFFATCRALCGNAGRRGHVPAVGQCGQVHHLPRTGIAAASNGSHFLNSGFH